MKDNAKLENAQKKLSQHTKRKVIHKDKDKDKAHKKRLKYTENTRTVFEGWKNIHFEYGLYILQ